MLSLSRESDKRYLESELDVDALLLAVCAKLQRSLRRTLEYHSGGKPGLTLLSISREGEVELCGGNDQ